MKVLNKNKYIILILLITTILLLELFISERYFGHDTTFHIANIFTISKNISLKSIFGTKLITFPCNQFGYGTAYFYPRLPHLTGAYLYLITKNIYTSMNIIYFITTFLSGAATYFLSKKVFNNKKIAVISAVIYLTVPYHISEIYIRDAFAENFMFLAAPLIFLGLYHLKDKEYKKFYITFILGYVIGMYSHLVSMVFCTIFVGLFILFNYKSFLKKEKIKALIKSSLIVTGLTLPFLITVIEYKLTNTYTVFLSDTFASRMGVISRALEVKQFINQEPMYDKIKPFFNYTTIILFTITTIMLLVKKIKYRKQLIPMLLIIIVLINFISSKVLWENIPDIFIMLQFPWRLLVFLSLFIALYSPACLLTKININKTFKKIIFCLLVSLITMEGISNISYYGNYVLTIEQTIKVRSAMGYQLEYLPIQTNQIKDRKYLYFSYVEKREKGILIDDNNTKITTEIIKEEFPNLTFKIDNIEEKTSIELPRVYYLGYTLKDENGNKIKLYNNERGFLGADITKSGEYKLYHDNTIPEKIANIIGILTLGFCIFKLVKRCKNEK